MEKPIAAILFANLGMLRPSGKKLMQRMQLGPVAKAKSGLMSEWCLMLCYLAHLVRDCSWPGKVALPVCKLNHQCFGVYSIETLVSSKKKCFSNALRHTLVVLEMH